MAQPRRKILNLQLHPIAVHFPIAFSVAALVFSFVTIFLSGQARTTLIDATKIIVLFIPILVIAAGIAGWLDGRVRFHKIRNSMILKRKIVYAIILFIISLALAVTIWIGGIRTWVYVLGTLLSIAGVVLIYLLGLLGTSIVGAAFPGK
jgi:uncharacterized membrane protein